MDYFFGSSDVYYRDRQPVTNSKVTATPMYQQSSDLNYSSDKYYAEMSVPATTGNIAGAKLQLRPKKEIELELVDTCYGLSTIQHAFEEGATSVRIKATEYILSQLRVAVDISVGRGELTREQADAITFVELAQEAIFVATKVYPTDSTPEAAAVINDSPKQSRKKTKRGKGDAITTKDIAAVFGSDDSDG